MLRSVSPTELASVLRVPPTSISRHVARVVLWLTHLRGSEVWRIHVG